MSVPSKALGHFPILKIKLNQSYPYVFSDGFRDLLLKNGNQIFKKYFGKKVPENKHIHSVDESYSTAHRLKHRKSTHLYSSIRPRSPLIQIKSLDIAGSSNLHIDPSDRRLPSPFKLLKSLIFKKLACYKHLTALKIAINPMPRFQMKPRFFKSIQTLTKLKYLSLSLSEDLLFTISGYILSLKGLDKIEVNVIRNRAVTTKEVPEAVATDFYVKLLDYEGLLFLKFDISDSIYMNKPKFSAIFLHKLSQTKIPSFHIHLMHVSSDEGRIEGLKTALENVELLTLAIPFCDVINCDTANNAYPSTAKPKRVLAISLNKADDFNQQGLSLPRSHFNNEAIPSISQMLGAFIENYYQIYTPLSDIFCLKRIREITLSLSSADKDKSREALLNLNWILRNSRDIEYLDVSWNILNFMCQKPIMNKQALIPEISKLEHLKSLRLPTSIEENNLEMLREMVLSLKNLEFLGLHILKIIPKDKNITPDFSLAFPENSKLKELDIKLPRITQESAQGLLNIILKLNNLEKLLFKMEEASEIFDTNQLLGFIENLFEKMQLKEIEIQEEVLQRSSIRNEKSTLGIAVKQTIKERVIKAAQSLFLRKRCLERFSWDVFGVRIDFERE